MITNFITKNFDRSFAIELANKSEHHNFLLKELLIKKILTIAAVNINLSQFNPGCSECFESDFDFLNKKFIKALSNKPIEILYDLSQMKSAQIFSELNSSYEQVILERECSYERVTRNLPESIRSGEKKLPEGYELEVLHHMQKGDWHAFANHDLEQFAHQVLALFRQQKITSSQFATSMFYWALRMDFPYESLTIIPLFHGTEINPVAFRSIQQTFETSNRFTFVCTKENLHRLFHAMQTQPESEKHLFVIKNKYSLNKHESSTNTLHSVSEIIQKLGHNMFHEFYYSEKLHIIENDLKEYKEALKYTYYELSATLHEAKNCEDNLRKTVIKKFKIKKVLKITDTDLKHLESFHKENPNDTLVKNDFDYALERHKKYREEYDSCKVEINLLEPKIDKLYEEISAIRMRQTVLRKKTYDLENELQTIKSHTSRMCVSLTLFQQFLNVCFGKNAVIASPVIGLSTLNDIANNSIYGTRDVGIPFPVNLQDSLLNNSEPVDTEPVDYVDDKYPLSKIPDSADGVAAPTYLDFWLHDTIFHGTMASMVPHEDQKKFHQMACLLENYDTINDGLVLFNHKLASRLVDMECPAYIPSLLFIKDQDGINRRYDENNGNMVKLTEDEQRMISFLHSLEQHVKVTINYLSRETGVEEQDIKSMISEESWLMDIAEQCIKHGILPKTLDTKIKSLVILDAETCSFLSCYFQLID